MINTNQTDYAAALKIGEEFKKVINDKYKKLEIDRDAVFERMLLLNKKKYAARKVEDDGKGGPGEVTTEIKGLDMKRREFSKLSKDASKCVLFLLPCVHRTAHWPCRTPTHRDVLDMILSAKATETVIEEIHEYLVDLGEKIRGGLKPLDDYIVFKVSPRVSTWIAAASLTPARHDETASRQEPRGIPRRQVAAARSSRAQDEGQGSLGKVGRCHPLHLLHPSRWRDDQDGAGRQRAPPGRRPQAGLDAQDWCARFLLSHVLPSRN